MSATGTGSAIYFEFFGEGADPAHLDGLESLIRGRGTVGGARQARLWRAVSGGTGTVLVCDLASPEAPDAVHARCQADLRETGRSLPMAWHTWAGRQVGPVQVGPAPRAGGLLIVALQPPEDEEEAFNRWYDEGHLPGLAAVTGVITARRYSAYFGEPGYVAIYEMDNPGVCLSEEWKAASAETPWSAWGRGQMSRRGPRWICAPHVV